MPCLGRKAPCHSVGVEMICCPREVKASNIFLFWHCVWEESPVLLQILEVDSKEDYITSLWEGKHPAPVLVVHICRVPVEILGQEQLSLLAFFVWEPSQTYFGGGVKILEWAPERRSNYLSLGRKTPSPQYWWGRL